MDLKGTQCLICEDVDCLVREEVVIKIPQGLVHSWSIGCQSCAALYILPQQFFSEGSLLLHFAARRRKSERRMYN